MLNRIKLPAVALLLGCSTIALAGGGTASASAGAPDSTPSKVARTVCVSEAVPVGSDATPPPPECYGSLSEAATAATDGTLVVPKGATTLTQAQVDAGARRAEARAVAASVVIGTSVDNPEPFTGRVWLHTAASGCDTDSGVEWQITYVGSSWNDDIDRGLAGFSDCQGQYFEHSDFGGAMVTTDWTEGSMEDEASSIRWI